METTHISTDVAIIGGGLAGLSAATYLARAGMDVTLFEKSQNLGGRAATQQYEGYAFNRGAHAFYYGSAGTTVLRELGITYSYKNPRDIQLYRQGRFFTAPASARTILRTSFLTVAEKLELVGLFTKLIRTKPGNFGALSTREWLDHHVRNPHLLQIMTAFARILAYCSNLDLMSAEVFLQRVVLSDVRYIDGGWQSIVESLRTRATEAGVHILTHARVCELLQHDGQMNGVCLADGRCVEARAVLIATTPASALALLNNAIYAPLQQKLATIRPVQVACLDVALRHLPVPQHAIVFDLEQPRFMTAQSRFVRVAPDGGALIHTFKALDPEQSSDPRQDERDLEQWLDLIQPGWRAVLVKRMYLPHIEAVSLLPTAYDGGLTGRPGIQVPGVSNLYLAGDWVGDAGYLVDASLASARNAAHLLIQHGLPAQGFPILNQKQGCKGRLVP
ncbi:MAG TPA: NAD(P)/FAD-dependent oxidoreductase [Dictyobacter sp.]|nr:NAD(P)/FAD-dependent oxidoreductase [Dictyobacter sp.]